MEKAPAYRCQLVKDHDGQHVVRAGLENLSYGAARTVAWPIPWADGCPYDVRAE